MILAKLDQGLTAKRIWQDLVAEHGFAACYHSVRRYVRRLGQGHAVPFRRMECGPGEEAQVDFGAGAWVVMPDGRRRRPHVFRIVLSHSRKAYSEAVWRQTTDAFLRCLENAFWHFGGAPERLVLDNLRAAVKQADWYDPELNPKVRAFGAHYGVVLLPTKPRTPRGTRGRSKKGSTTSRTTRWRGTSLAAWKKRTPICGIGRRPWRTRVCTARRGNRSARCS